MESHEREKSPGARTGWQLIDIINTIVKAQELNQYSEALLSGISRLTGSSHTCLMVVDPRLSGEDFFSSGIETDLELSVKDLCETTFERFCQESNLESLTGSMISRLDEPGEWVLRPMRFEHGCLGVVGVGENGGTSSQAEISWEKLLNSLATILDCLLDRLDTRKQLSHLNSYLTVSSTLSQSMDLHELLELSLYCCMEAVPVEAASILLLDDEKRNFTFYELEGTAKQILKSATFPADRGIAGAVLETRAAEIINDAYSDPRFYGRVDSSTGFHTRNILAIPLIAGEEKVGVLEFINKIDGGPFMEEELLWLTPLADEMAFAVRNAIVFEYVANTYCKQRQGMMSCRGCQRPLGSWTPCVKYRDVGVLKDSAQAGDTLKLPRE